MDANILEISIFYYCFILTPLASKIDSCNPPSDSIIILKSLIVAIFFHPKPIEIIFGKLRSIGIGGLLDFDATLPLGNSSDFINSFVSYLISFFIWY